MAVDKITRPKSGHARKPPQTPRYKPAPKSRTQSPTATAVLADVRARLTAVMAVAYVTSAALKAQRADVDCEAAVALQRYVGDEIDRQIERLDILAARCQEGKS